MKRSTEPLQRSVAQYLETSPSLPMIARHYEKFFASVPELEYPAPGKAPPPLPPMDGCSPEQKRAICTALSAPLSYITAPPGCGKTRMVLVRCVVSLLRGQRRVLIATPTNSAVELALGAVLDALGPEAVAYASQRLGWCSPEFHQRYGQVCSHGTGQPALIGTTLDTLVKLLPHLHCCGFSPDHIFLDEAAYAPLVKALPLLSFSGARLTLFGDHHQLPPVCTVLEKDLRSHPELQFWKRSAVELGSFFDASSPSYRTDFFPYTQVCTLTRSYRYGTRLAQVLSPRIYNGKLVGAAPHGTEIEVIHVPSDSVLSGQRPQSSYGEALAVRERIAPLEQGSFAVLTPYVKQKALLSHVLTGAPSECVRTIHSVQGMEWETVVLSVADSPSPLLTDSDNLTLHGLELLNTAVSRAKKKLILVCDVERWLARPAQLLTELICLGM